MPVPQLGPDPRLFPDPRGADEDGLVAWGGDLRPERLLAAYSLGIFPWPHEGMPLLWFSPEPRMVLPLRPIGVGGDGDGEAGPRISRRLARTLRQGHFEVRLDEDFDAVIAACASTPRPHEAGTWITEEMQTAYGRLHRLGFAHCAGAWRDGRLVGGIYGVSIGGTFCGESMFHRERDASKVALVTLAQHLASAGLDLFDAQLPTEHLASLGFREWSRDRYLDVLATSVARPTLRGPWSLGSTFSVAEEA